MEVGSLHLERYLILSSEVGPAPHYTGYVTYRCLICEEKDPELYSGLIYTARRSEIKHVPSRCGCVKRLNYTQEQWVVLIERKCKQHNAEFLGFAENFVGNKTRLILKQDEDIWQSTTIDKLFYRDGFSNPVKYNRERSSGSLARKPDEEMIATFINTCAFPEGTRFTRNSERKSKGGVRVYWDIYCPVCDLTNTSTYSSLQEGRVPCNCCVVKPPCYAYIHLLSESIIKFGITNSLSRFRLKQQSAAYGKNLIEIGTWEFSNSQSCRSAELCCKRDLIGPVISKDDFPDGYTETTYSYNIDNVIEIYENFGGVRCQAIA